MMNQKVEKEVEEIFACILISDSHPSLPRNNYYPLVKSLSLSVSTAQPHTQLASSHPPCENFPLFFILFGGRENSGKKNTKIKSKDLVVGVSFMQAAPPAI